MAASGAELADRLETGAPADAAPDGVDWRDAFRFDARTVSLPSYPWRRRPYWRDDPPGCDDLAALLGVPPEQDCRRRTLLELGVDSLRAMELRDRLEENYGLRLGPVHELYTVTVGTLSEWVREAGGGGAR
jgi:acyl carrier protein